MAKYELYQEEQLSYPNGNPFTRIKQKTNYRDPFEIETVYNDFRRMWKEIAEKDDSFEFNEKHCLELVNKKLGWKKSVYVFFNEQNSKEADMVFERLDKGFEYEDKTNKGNTQIVG